MSEPRCRTLFERRLDAGRVVLPQNLRDALGPRIGLAADISGSILLTTASSSQALLEDLLTCSQQHHQSGELYRLLASTYAEDGLDERGRLLLPHLHREWAGIGADSEVLLLALGEGIQVWDPLRLDRLLRVSQRHLRELHNVAPRDQFRLFEDV
jgi:DNA-binding transcriptional regulator/RsmH inhibitor MraZ